mmetsp:Transcript_7704/g.11598  ORF Transcript_7704/g.11598 Transcript_7704/m.11598 type:complete len:208 (+) Transcript_7704:41-664(+)|eukprot:CAMPEP_0171454218 /NCGR_PEP_ID=MMETSP0945-20130129/1596_1 /TAXON_ID=109269 /ORGANISM="Vaucheria litorea, Strain CCMP2940" /LENGTH=207 /DNA_ID=CAMNT_0011979205 /DNA_START=27 /DNA_END=650 /DNA_ORIENTATION=-
MKHNNVIQNSHFRKHWQRRVKTWFDQPARKLRRRENRVKKALKVAPRPAKGPLRPVVRCQTVRYNMRTRFGRGFTLDELKEAGVNRKEARNIGITVDHRRKNRCEESLKTNAQRLKMYKSKLIVFPRREGKFKAGDSQQSELASATQFKGTLMPISKPNKGEKAQVITEEDKKYSAVKALQTARADVKLAPNRRKRAYRRQNAAKKK